MHRFTNSWEVAKQSWRVLCNNPRLAFFPFLSGIATILVSAMFIAPTIFAYLGTSTSHRAERFQQPLLYVISFCMYAAVYFVVIFFNSALVACAHRNLLGQSATISDGLNEAWRHLPKIMGWSLIAATVGQIIRTLQEKSGLVGAIVGMIFGFAWNMAIFFVVPIMVIEDMGPVAALKASAERIKRTWGEQLILNGGLGLISFFTVVLPIMALVAAAVFFLIADYFVAAAIAGIVALLWLLVGLAIMSAMNVIYQTALYMYTSNGVVSTWYSQQTIQGAFVPKTSRR